MTSASSPPSVPAWASAMERYFSRDRVSKYRTHVPGGHLAKALALYWWNAAASAALFEVLGYVEVVLRNAMDEQLQAHHQQHHGSGDWWDDPSGQLDNRRIEDIDAATAQVTRTPITHGRIVAETNFGLWRYLLASRYETTLWTQSLRHAFPHLKPARRSDIYEPVERLHAVRNRIAHHEPIHTFNLDARHDDAMFVLGSISPDIQGRVQFWSRWPAVKANRP